MIICGSSDDPYPRQQALLPGDQDGAGPRGTSSPVLESFSSAERDSRLFGLIDSVDENPRFLCAALWYRTCWGRGEVSTSPHLDPTAHICKMTERIIYALLYSSAINAHVISGGAHYVFLWVYVEYTSVSKTWFPDLLFLYLHVHTQTMGSDATALSWFANSLTKIGLNSVNFSWSIVRAAGLKSILQVLAEPRLCVLAATRVRVCLLTSAEQRLHDLASQRGFTEWHRARPQAD